MLRATLERDTTQRLLQWVKHGIRRAVTASKTARLNRHSFRIDRAAQVGYKAHSEDLRLDGSAAPGVFVSGRFRF